MGPDLVGDRRETGRRCGLAGEMDVLNTGAQGSHDIARPVGTIENAGRRHARVGSPCGRQQHAEPCRAGVRRGRRGAHQADRDSAFGCDAGRRQSIWQVVNDGAQGGWSRFGRQWRASVSIDRAVLTLPNGPGPCHHGTASFFGGRLMDVHALLAEAVDRHKAGRLCEAETDYRRVLRLDPGHVEAMHLLGVTLAQRGRAADALPWLQKAAGLAPDSVSTHSNLGAALRQLGRLEEAERHLRRAFGLQPESIDVGVNLAAVLHDRNALWHASEYLSAVLRRNPDHVRALINLGAVRRDQGRLEEAADLFLRAVIRAPQAGEAHFGLAVTLLVGGDLVAGWPEFEWRWARPGLVRRRFREPRWRGEPLVGRTLLLYAEQGRGDTIQFVRFARLARAAGGRIVLQCQRELLDVMETVAGVDAVYEDDGSTPPCDVQCPLMSLPAVFGLDLGSVGAPLPYVSADPVRRAHWRAVLGLTNTDLACGFRIGLVWAGTPTHPNDRNRSIPLPDLAPLLEVPGLRWFSLQVGPSRAAAVEAGGGGRLEDIGHRLGNFADTAAVLADLDLVVTVDTAVAHLAGALHRPAWVLLPYAPDWRWLLERSDSPWYPTLRLFRQTAPGDWSPVVAAVADSLKTWKPRDAGGSGGGMDEAMVPRPLSGSPTSPQANALSTSKGPDSLFTF